MAQREVRSHIRQDTVLAVFMSRPSVVPAAGLGAGEHSRMKAESSAGRLLTAKSAAQYLGVPYTTLRDWAHRGILPVVRFPECRRWWIDRHDLDRLVERFKEMDD